MTLEAHWALIGAEYQRSLAAPLSLRQALLVAVLLDHFPDRVFAEYRDNRPALFEGAEDAPAWRAQLAARSAALARVFALGSGAAMLRVAAVEVPIADYAALPVEDFMVSLYNGNSVQRVMIVMPDGSTQLAHPVLRAAVDYWDGAGCAERGAPGGGPFLRAHPVKAPSPDPRGSTPPPGRGEQGRQHCFAVISMHGEGRGRAGKILREIPKFLSFGLAGNWFSPLTFGAHRRPALATDRRSVAAVPPLPNTCCQWQRWLVFHRRV